MPPKKAVATSVVGAYNVQIMNDKELKDYIKALLEEIDRIKLTLTQHQNKNISLSYFLKNTDIEIQKMYEKLTQKDVEIQNQLSDSYNLLKKEQKRHVLTKLEIKEKEALRAVEAFKKVQETKLHCREDNDNLREIVSVKTTDLMRNRFDRKFISIDAKEKVEQQLLTSMEENQNQIKIIAEDHIKKYRKATQEFVEEKVGRLGGIWESLLGNGVIDRSFGEYIDKMSCYFMELFWKNLEVTTTLTSKVFKLEYELNKTKLLIRDAKRKNKMLFTTTSTKNSSLIDKEQEEVTNLEKENNLKVKKLNELIYEKDVLNEKLKLVKKEREASRNRFVSAVRKIYRKADFRTLLLEQMLISLQNKTCSDKNISIPIYYFTLPKKPG